LREFNPPDVRFGSVPTRAIEATPRRMSASPRKRPLASKRNPARGHPLAGLVQHSAGLHGVIAAQRPTAGLDRPTIAKLALALRSSVTAITKERISLPSCAERNLHSVLRIALRGTAKDYCAVGSQSRLCRFRVIFASIPARDPLHVRSTANSDRIDVSPRTDAKCQ
jgi:hypothetical protein